MSRPRYKQHRGVDDDYGVDGVDSEGRKYKMISSQASKISKYSSNMPNQNLLNQVRGVSRRIAAF
jgi:hypothetical protein